MLSAGEPVFNLHLAHQLQFPHKQLPFFLSHLFLRTIIRFNASIPYRSVNMSRSRLPLYLGLGVAGVGGYYLYSAGGDPKVAQKKAERMRHASTTTFMFKG